MTEEIEKHQQLNRTLLLTGTLLFITYYLADCALDSVIIGEGTFIGNLLNPSAHELAIRALSGFFLFSLYIVSTILINRNRSLQKKLLSKTEEILETNRELDTYNHTLSQELRNSLTSILLSKEKLKFDCFQCESQRGKKLLGQLSEDCDHLSDRISELLQYSEVNRAKLERKRVAIDDIAREIAKTIAMNSEEQSLDFQIDNNLETDCDPKLMHVALKNLIDCSIKQKSPHQHNEIRIGMKKREGVPVYYIRTNSPAASQALPQPKARAHQPPSSNVINIKTARAIIERHGGQLWAKDTTRDNPVFYFTL